MSTFFYYDTNPVRLLQHNESDFELSTVEGRLRGVPGTD